MDFTRLVTTKGFFNRKKVAIEPHLKPVEGEVRLFRTVLDKALLDLLMEPVETKLFKDTYDWFFDEFNEKPFLLIVSLAFLEPEDVRNKVEKILRVESKNIF